MPRTSHPPELQQLRRLRFVALLEGGSLLLLLLIAVPLKHLAGLPGVVSWVGPLHGLLFLTYLWFVFNTASSRAWPPADVGRLLLAALLPFGALWSAAVLQRRQAELEGDAWPRTQGLAK